MTTPNTDIQVMQAMASLFKKKAAVMDALGGGMEKKGKNEHFDYKFVTASDIKRTVSALFHTHGLSLQMSGIHTDNVTTLVEVKDYKTQSVRMKEVPILRIQFSISLCDIDTGAVEQSFWFGEAGATDDKAASKAATSALKYFLISNLLIADKDEDTHDTDLDRRKGRQEKASPAPMQSSPAKQTVVPAPHWSADKTMMDKMYAWALKEHKYTPDLVDKAIATSGKKLSELDRDQVKLIVAEDAQRIPF